MRLSIDVTWQFSKASVDRLGTVSLLARLYLLIEDLRGSRGYDRRRTVLYSVTANPQS